MFQKQQTLNPTQVTERYFFVCEREQNKYMGEKSERIFELLPFAGSTSRAEDITPRQFVLALTNLLLRTGESKSFTLQAAEDAVSPLPSSIPLSPVSTNSRTHSSALWSAPRTSAGSIRTHFFSSSHNTSIHGHSLLLSCTEVRKLAEQLDGSDVNSEIFAHPSCRLPLESFGPILYLQWAT